MNNQRNYIPDYNAPPGIPSGFPYALNPSIPSNPLYPPSHAPGYPGSYPPDIPGGYPAAGFVQSTASYPASNIPTSSNVYPINNNMGSAVSYPAANTMGTGMPYPAGAYPNPEPQPYPVMGSQNACGSMYPAAGMSQHPSQSYPASGFQGSNYPPLRSEHIPAQPPPYSSTEGHHSYQVSGHHPLSSQSSRMAYYTPGEGTVRPYPNFDPKQDAEVLRKAMKGLGTDEKSIIKVLANRSNSQRVYIDVAFKQLYGKDLIEDLKSELSGNFEQVILGLMMPTNDYLASQMHKAISGIGTDEDVLAEILCTRTNQEIWSINEAYGRLYGKSLESDIKGDTSGHFQRLLVSCCTGARSEDPADSARAKQTAEALYQAGVGQWGTDESIFNSILVAESFQQLAHTFYEYQKLTGHTVVQAIESEMSGDLKQGMLAIAKCVENRPFYFAEKLYKAMKVGLGTDDDTLIRIVVSRCEIDMVQIKAEYERNYGKPLSAAIADDTSGDYKRVLVALVDPN